MGIASSPSSKDEKPLKRDLLSRTISSVIRPGIADESSKSSAKPGESTSTAELPEKNKSRRASADAEVPDLEYVDDIYSSIHLCMCVCVRVAGHTSTNASRRYRHQPRVISRLLSAAAFQDHAFKARNDSNRINGRSCRIWN